MELLEVSVTLLWAGCVTLAWVPTAVSSLESLLREALMQAHGPVSLTLWAEACPGSSFFYGSKKSC